MKIKLTKGLSLNKKSITRFQESQMSHFKGRNAQGVGNVLYIDDSCIGTCQKMSCS
ncbi:class I lanthipeptide [Flavobacterium sp. ZS1P70]|uniref:Class I lanthipeptide n=1 Tax=Flavobacterium zhoui TaxID=3230414 RepID=A0ABW6I7C3_9FLAO